MRYAASLARQQLSTVSVRLVCVTDLEVHCACPDAMDQTQMWEDDAVVKSTSASWSEFCDLGLRSTSFAPVDHHVTT